MYNKILRLAKSLRHVALFNCLSNIYFVIILKMPIFADTDL